MIPFLLGFFILFTAARAETIAFLVNEKNPQVKLSRGQVSDFFLKKLKSWPDGVLVRFIDRTDSSPERNEFLRTIIRKSSRDIELFWIGQKLYSGHSAPSQVSSDAMVETMVSRFPGGIGYVSKDFVPTKAVKKIPVTEN